MRLIKSIEILDLDTHNERIRFDVNVPKVVNESSLWCINLQLLECSETGEKSLIRFCIHKMKSADEYCEDNSSNTVNPF